MRNYGICHARNLEKLVDEVNKYVEKGYEPTGGILSTRQVGMPYVQAMFKKPTKTVKKQAARNEYPAEFESLWKAYPKRSGQNPKKKAYQAWNARLDGDTLPYEIFRGVERYAAYIKATNMDPKYVMMAATFFGPEEHFLNDWEAPEVSSQLPKRDNELVAYAQKNGLALPNVGEEMWQYRARLQGEA